MWNKIQKAFTPTPQRRLVRGFTLIELLVVISVIGLLASVVLVSLNSARVKARDTQRKATLRQLKTALDLYYDVNNSYPIGGWFCSEPGCVNYNNSWVPGLVPAYVASLPRDPYIGGSNNCGINERGYLYLSLDGKNYKLLAHCTPEGALDPGDAFYDPVRMASDWMVCSGEPACSTW